MADDKKDINLNINPKVTDTNSVRDLMHDLEQIDKLTSRIYEKGKNNNFHISAKDYANVRGVAGNIRKNANKVNDQLNNSMSMYDQLRASGKGSSSEMHRLEQMSYKLMSAMYKAQSKGYNAQKGTINPGGHFNDILNFKVNTNNKRFNDLGSKSVNDFNSQMKLMLRDFGSRANNIRSTANKLNANIGNTIQYGTVSYEKLQQYRAALKMNPSRADDLQSSMNEYMNQIQAQRRNVGSQISSISNREKAGYYSAQEKNSDNSRKIALQHEQEALNKAIQRLNEFSQVLNNSKSTITKTRNNLETAINPATGATAGGAAGGGFSGNGGTGGVISEGGATGGPGGSGNNGILKVRAARGSFRGILANRLPSIVRGGTSTAIAGISGLYSSGANSRLQSADQIMSIDEALANSGVNTNGRYDNRILNNLSNLGINNGTEYSSSDMAGFASAYTSSTGNARGYARAANLYSQLSRYSGVGTKTTEELETAAGNAGVRGAGLANSVAGELTNSGMTAKSGEQVSALSNIINNASSVGMNTSNARQLSALQGTMARYGSTVQGSNFSSSYNKLSNGFSNTNNPVSRFLLGGNSPKYAGVEGAARLQEHAENIKSHPAEMGTVIGRALASNGNNTEQTAYVLDREFGISMKQAKAYIKDYKAGHFSKSYLEQQAKRNSRTRSGNGSNAYGSSGTRTLQEQRAERQRATEHTSESNDFMRGLGNGLGASLPPTLLGLGIVGGSTALHAAGDIGSSYIAGNIGRATTSMLGNTRIGKALSNFHPVNWFKGLFRGGSSAAEGAAEGAGRGGILNGAKNIGRSVLERGRSLGGSLLEKGRGIFGSTVEGVRNGGFLSGAKNIGRSVLERGKSLGGSLLEKGRGIFGDFKGVSNADDVVGDIAKGGSRLTKGSGILSAAFTGLDLAHTISTTKAGTRKRHRGIGSDIGAGAGGVIGGALGSVAGPWGTVAGSVAGSWLGGKAGGAIGNIFGNSKKSKSKESKTDDSDTKSERNKSNNTRSKLNKEQKSLLKGFNDMLYRAEKVIAEAKTIQQGGSSDSDSSISGTSGKGNAAIKSVAAKVAKALGVDPSLVYGQLATESAYGKDTAGTNNYGGIKYSSGTKGETKGSTSPEGNSYANFDSLDDFATKYASILKNAGISGNMSASEYVSALKKAGYFTGNESTYLKNLTSAASKYNSSNHATGGMFSTATNLGNSNIVGEDGLESAIPVNGRHLQQGISMLNQTANMLGKMVVDPGKVNGNSSSNITFNPTNHIEINAGNGANTSDISKAVSRAVGEQNERTAAQLRSYYANFG